MPLINQQGNENEWYPKADGEHCPRVVGRIVVGDDDLVYVAYAIAHQPDSYPDNGCDPELSPKPVAEDPQSTEGEIRDRHFGLEGVAGRPADRFGGLFGENSMADECKNESHPDLYNEKPQ